MTPLAWVLALFLSICATNAFATDADVPTGPARLYGEWKLDWDRSDSFESTMTALETPWLLRRLAGVARVGVEYRATSNNDACDDCPEMILMTLSTPVSTKEVEVVLDGKPRPGEDPRGRATLDRFRWSSEDGLEMTRELELPSGSQARLIEIRNLGADPDTLVSHLTVWVDDVERASIDRLFVRTNK